LTRLRRSILDIVLLIGVVAIGIWAPFNWPAKLAAAVAFYLAGGFVIGRLFKRLATPSAVVADLRDRVDTPPL
jgi:hypothetical protein